MDDAIRKEVQGNLKAAEKYLVEARSDIEDARRAGIDISSELATLRDAEQKLARLKAVYGGK